MWGVFSCVFDTKGRDPEDVVDEFPNHGQAVGFVAFVVGTTERERVLEL